MIDLDTHVVVWLYSGLLSRLSASVRDLLEAESLYISPTVTLELQYLCETGRTSELGGVVVQELGQRIGLRVHEDPLHQVISRALEQNWTRDPFDRLIVGQSALRDTILITKDRVILKHYPQAFWNAT